MSDENGTVLTFELTPAKTEPPEAMTLEMVTVRFCCEEQFPQER
jgi:hypothetical protein